MIRRACLFRVLATPVARQRYHPKRQVGDEQHSPQQEQRRRRQSGDGDGKSSVSRTESRGAVSTTTKSFWCCEAERMTEYDVKRQFADDRFLDKKIRFVARQRLREDGVTSNFFLLHIDPKKVLYSYEIEATRRVLCTNPPGPHRETSSKTVRKAKWSRTKGGAAGTEACTSSPGGDGPNVKRVDATRAWRVVQRFIQRCFPEAPPLVCVRQKVYATSPIPTKALTLPAEYFDMGWEACKLHFLGKVPMAELQPPDMQELTNKIVFLALRQHRGRKEKMFSVAKEVTGKLVYTHDNIAVGGLRIFKGTIVRAVYIDASAAVDAPSSSFPSMNSIANRPPSSAVLMTLSAGHHSSEPLRFLVKEFLRQFEYKNTPVQSYRIEDASGVIMASLWKASDDTKLNLGVVYEVTNYRVRVFESRGGMRLVEMTAGETVLKALEPELPPQQEIGGEEDERGASPTGGLNTKKKRQWNDGGQSERNVKKVQQQQQQQSRVALNTVPDARGMSSMPSMPGDLALKIDTKCTVASELSLWEEVKQHFGSGPYDSATEERIARSVQGTPVVISMTLRHSTVRIVRFNVSSSEVCLEPEMQQFLRELEPGQPYAVLSDYSVIPLQALHCCYDPRMKSWQVITVSTCSFLPKRRVSVLEIFRGALETGLQLWGLSLAQQPCVSKAISVLPAPKKMLSFLPGQKEQQKKFELLRHKHPVSFPTTIAVVAIAAAHVNEEERTRSTKTAQALARYFHTTISITVVDEKEAVRFLVQQLTSASDEALVDPNTVAIIVSAERDTRPSRWVLAECLTRGILALFIPPASSPKRQNLLCENIRMRLGTVFEADPVRRVNIAHEVPAIAKRRVLVVGIDACHTTTISTGSIVGILCAPERSHLLPLFWKHETRGQEVEQVGEHFRILMQRASELYDGVDEVVVFQDGDIFSEMRQMKEHLAPHCGFTFTCLHKRSNVRFVHELKEENGETNVRTGNVVKGAVVQAFTPVVQGDESVLASFYLQNHNCCMSTARTVHYTVHSVSPSLDISDVQQLSHVFSHLMATQATKLPLPTRCAHRLASVAERLLDAAPPLRCDMIPAPLNERLWFF